ncbi:YebC/PmpR family DNA-binding transcriptional regulator [Patescibacteria group bacterium]|nr:YebC/PmpR family DNA-binding transcriptional regulator [Patescibacteria group bacterium]
MTDYTFDGDICRVTTTKEYFNTVLKNIDHLGYKIATGSLIRESTNPLEIDDETYAKVERIKEVLEDDDDIEEVYDNIL